MVFMIPAQKKSQECPSEGSLVTAGTVPFLVCVWLHFSAVQVLQLCPVENISFIAWEVNKPGAESRIKNKKKTNKHTFVLLTNLN